MSQYMERKLLDRSIPFNKIFEKTKSRLEEIAKKLEVNKKILDDFSFSSNPVFQNF